MNVWIGPTDGRGLGLFAPCFPVLLCCSTSYNNNHYVWKTPFVVFVYFFVEGVISREYGGGLIL